MIDYSIKKKKSAIFCSLTPNNYRRKVFDIFKTNNQRNNLNLKFNNNKFDDEKKIRRKKPVENFSKYRKTFNDFFSKTNEKNDKMDEEILFNKLNTSCLGSYRWKSQLAKNRLFNNSIELSSNLEKNPIMKS